MAFIKSPNAFYDLNLPENSTDDLKGAKNLRIVARADEIYLSFFSAVSIAAFVKGASGTVFIISQIFAKKFLHPEISKPAASDFWKKAR